MTSLPRDAAQAPPLDAESLGFALPTGFEARRIIRFGRKILCFSNPAALALGTKRGYVSVDEGIFDQGNLGTVLGKIFDDLT